jgi:hypothetical protein
VQVSRWGLPMITHILLSDPSLHDASENYNRAVPADEVALFSKPIREFVEKVTALAHSAADPSAYATQRLASLCPSVLPYELDTPASFSFAAFNGRSLCDDVMDVILTLVTNTALGDGVAAIAAVNRRSEKNKLRLHFQTTFPEPSRLAPNGAVRDDPVLRHSSTLQLFSGSGFIVVVLLRVRMRVKRSSHDIPQ